jgi:hypothetical protein
LHVNNRAFYPKMSVFLCQFVSIKRW